MARSKQQIWLFGNPDYQPDALPLKIAPALKKKLPHLNFVIKDPHEEWDLPDKLIIIDTIKGLKKVTTFSSLADFKDSPRLTMHDFDLLTNLKWLAKLNKLPPFLIIGLPAGLTKNKALDQIPRHLPKN